MLLEHIIGSDARLKILIYLSRHNSGYQREIEIELRLPLFAVQSQLKALEAEGLVRRWQVKNRHYYGFRPEYPLYKELRSLFRKAGRLAKGDGSPVRGTPRGRRKTRKR